MARQRFHSPKGHCGCSDGLNACSDRWGKNRPPAIRNFFPVTVVGLPVKPAIQLDNQIPITYTDKWWNSG